MAKAKEKIFEEPQVLEDSFQAPEPIPVQVVEIQGISAEPEFDATAEIERLLKAFLSRSAYEYWKFVNTEIPPVFHLASSSSGKYHKGNTGIVNTVGLHTLEMIQTTLNCGLKIFNLEPGDTKADVILLAVALHDRCKRGRMNNEAHTNGMHEEIMAQFVLETAMDWFDPEPLAMLVDMIKWHSGRWAPANGGWKNEPNWNKFSLYIHMIDVFSANRRLVLDQ